MSIADEPLAETTHTNQPAARRNSTQKWDALLDGLHRYRRAVGTVAAATAALSLNGALLSGFDTVARRGPGADAEVAAQMAANKAIPGIETALQAAVQKREVRRVELPPVQIVGRRQAPDVQMATTAGPSVAIGTAKPAPAPEAAASAPLIEEITASNRNAGLGLAATRVESLFYSTLEQKQSLPASALTRQPP
jgi:hypothetical protein